MKIKFNFLIILLCFYAGASTSQETGKKFFGIEAGMTLISCEMPDMTYIRGDMLSYPSDFALSSITSLMYNSFAGIKSEFFSANDKFGFAGGVRYTLTVGSIGKRNYWANNTNYFYLLFRQDGINTEYLKVKDIIQSSDCIGIPLEVRFFPYKPRWFRLYFKLGAEINFRLQTNTDVVFYDNLMEGYQKEVAEIVGQPESFSSSIYGAVGIRIGRKLRPALNLEIAVPVVFLTSESSAMVNPVAGGGFQLNVQLPYKLNAQ